MKAHRTLRQVLRVAFLREDPRRPRAIRDFLEAGRMRGWTPRTRESYEVILRTIETFLGHPLVDATHEEAKAYLSHHDARGVASGTVNKHLFTMRSFYRWAIDEEMITVDPTRKIKPAKKAGRLPGYLSDDQVTALLATMAQMGDSLAERRAACVLAMLYYTGMRAGELVSLDIERIDRHAGTMVLRGKGDKERIASIHPHLSPYLDRWLAVHPTGQGALLVSSFRPYGRLGYDALADIVQGIYRRAGLGKIPRPCAPSRAPTPSTSSPSSGTASASPRSCAARW